MISQWYDPEVGSAAQAGIIARSLRELGHGVEIVTGLPNYPSGKLYPGYQPAIYQSEVLDGIKVHRAPLYPSHDGNSLRRSANYLSFAAAGSLVANLKMSKVDACLVYASPATAALPAMVRRILRRTPFVVHIHDLWPDSVMSSGFLSRRGAAAASWPLSKFCSAMYRSSHAIAITSPGMREKLVSRGVPDNKIHFVPNWADESIFYPTTASAELRQSLDVGDQTVIMYAGNLGEYQDLEALVGAATRLKDRKDLLFLVVGDGVKRAELQRLADEAELPNLRFLGPRRLAEMPDLISLSDLQVVSLKSLEIFETTLPSKLMSVMASGRPILAALTGDAGGLVQESGAGYVVPPGDSLAMAAAIQQFARLAPEDRERMGRAGLEYYQSKLARSTVSARLAGLLTAAAASRKRRA